MKRGGVQGRLIYRVFRSHPAQKPRKLKQRSSRIFSKDISVDFGHEPKLARALPQHMLAEPSGSFGLAVTRLAHCGAYERTIAVIG
mgnify:CR=1 FL=1